MASSYNSEPTPAAPSTEPEDDCDRCRMDGLFHLGPCIRAAAPSTEVASGGEREALDLKYPEAYSLMLGFYTSRAYYNSDSRCRPADNVLMAIQYALDNPAASTRAGEELEWLEDRDNLILANSTQADGWWEVRRSSVKGEVRGRGPTPRKALQAAMLAAATLTDQQAAAKGEG